MLYEQQYAVLYFNIEVLIYNLLVNWCVSVI